MITIRCDDIFIDTDSEAVERIWNPVHKIGFKHIIAITPQGRGTPLHHQKPLKRGNQWILNATGEDSISGNKELINVISKYQERGAKIAIHGLKHINYRELEIKEQRRHIRKAKNILEPLFGEVEYFVPPFNKSNEGTANTCKKLNLKLVPSYYGVDTKIINNNVRRAPIRQIAKEVIAAGNCAYHPYWLQGGWPSMKHDINDRTFNIPSANWTLDEAMPKWNRLLKLIS